MGGLRNGSVLPTAISPNSPPLVEFAISQLVPNPGLNIKHLVYMPVGHMVLKIYVPCKNFHVPSQYLYKPCKAYAYCWENKYMPRLKNHLPSRARNHKILCALGQDLHARACGHPLMSSPANLLFCIFSLKMILLKLPPHLPGSQCIVDHMRWHDMVHGAMCYMIVIHVIWNDSMAHMIR